MNPYAPPAAVVAHLDPSSGVAPTYKLHTPGHIGLATFLGTPVAGALLMANNDRLLGQKNRGLVAVALSVLATGVLIAIAFALPSFPSAPFSIGAVVAMHYIAKARYTRVLDDHRAAGGQRASAWWAALAAVGVVVLLMVIIFPILLVKGVFEAS